jgi:hypothetical protein
MNEITIARSPCTDNFKIISPGVVGSVGDVNMATRMRTSNAALFPVMFGNGSSNEPRMGSDITDGDTLNQVNGGGYPATVDAYKWNYGGRGKTDVGYKFQDLRQNSRYVEPVVVGNNHYDFINATAIVHRQMGKQFTPLPGGYSTSANMLTRGGLFPAIVQTTDPHAIPDEPVRDKFGRIITSAMASSTTLGAKPKIEYIK